MCLSTRKNFKKRRGAKVAKVLEGRPQGKNFRLYRLVSSYTETMERPNVEWAVNLKYTLSYDKVDLRQWYDSTDYSDWSNNFCQDCSIPKERRPMSCDTKAVVRRHRTIGL